MGKPLLLLVVVGLICIAVYLLYEKYRSKSPPTMLVPATFRILRIRNDETREDALLFQFSDSEIEVTRGTARMLQVGPGIYEHRDPDGHVLQLRFDDAGQFLPFLEEQGDIIELGVIREIHALPRRPQQKYRQLNR